LNRAEYFVPIIVKIPGRELALAKRFGAEHTVIDFLCEIKDQAGGIPVSNLRDYVDVKLSDNTAAELAHRPVEYDTGFTLLPGKYVIKFLARDDETGRIGTFQTSFIIPNLNKEKRLPISSVVLSSQRIELKDAIYNAARDKGRAELSNPLVQSGTKLIPSVTRVFRADQQMYVYLQAYERDTASARPLVGFVSFHRGNDKRVETRPIEVTEASGHLNVVQFEFSIPLKELTPGEYACQVSVLDPSGQKATFWEAPVVIVQ